MKRVLVGLLLIGLASACIPGLYTFKGTSIDQSVETFYVGQFKLTPTNAPATLDNSFEQALRDRIRRDLSRLKEDQVQPHIEFQGTIDSYDISYQAPQANEQIGFNRLTMRVRIEYIDNMDEEKNWTQAFSRFSDFAADQNLLDVQESLIDDLNTQLIEDIFNKAFTDW